MAGVDGEVFGRYRLLELLREGDSGAVYRAHDTTMNREVAIKVLPPELAAKPGRQERFRREISIAARLNNPNIIPIYETGEIDGRLYLTMPLLADGVTLQELLRDGPLRPMVAAQVIVQASTALEAAHSSGLVHGDLKPSNMLVGGAFVYLTDFGAGGGDTVDPRADIYALTAVLYECLTGRPAPEPATVAEHGPPKLTDVDAAIPVEFDEVIRRGMADNPDDRYQTVRELAIAVHDAVMPGATVLIPVSPKEVEFGRFRLFEKLGQGNMGAVFRAHDTAMGRDVAIKLLQPEFAAEPGFQERFRREAYAAGRLASPNIIPIYETGEIDGRLYLVMPIVNGVDLKEALRRDGPMSPERAVRIVEQVAAALEAAHRSGLVHRDVKPSNLLMVGDDFVYLIDFGLVHEASAARVTLTNVVPGSPAYMAPERFDAATTADARGDVYSLAVVLFECLTGRVPFSGGGVEGVAAAHRTDEPPRPSSVDPAIPVGFDAVIARGMAKEPVDRYQSATELAAAARAALTEVSAAIPEDHASRDTVPTVPSPPPTPRQGRGRARVLTIAAVAVVVVVAVITSLRLTNQFPFPSAKARGQIVLPFSGLNNPKEIAVDAKGDVYVTDSGNNRLLKLAAGSTSQTVVPLAGLDGPEDIAVDDVGDLAVTEPARHRVLQLAAGSTNPTVLGFTDLGEPTGVAIDLREHGPRGRQDRAVVVADATHNRVVELLAQSTQETELPFTGLACPSAVAVDGDGALFVIDRDNERVLKLPWKATVPSVLPFVVGHPEDVAVDSSGDVYVTESHGNRVTKFVTASNSSETLPFNGVNHPQGISVDNAGNVYVVDSGNNRVLKLPPG
ncbi:serine/threonine-protein kinase PknD [Mycobacterium shigaense]|uniref:non-specific serine/threonine protein kinase n=1 Tax=Mycobacterium shigaense TaxID=722731 RepID=A0A1Z4EE84_9MYCO|nr:serine/threonine-protein kinase PknD [Mycobacterium shigaense]BAX91267.1 serine/threonine-protein kinase PknD [Mycobacterium shigaense]